MVLNGKLVRVLAFLVVLGSLADSAMARRNNPPAGVNGSTASGGASCMACHGSATGPGMVEILGLPPAYVPSQVYNLTVRVSDSTRFGAGFQFSAEDPVGTHVGTLILTDAVNTKLNSGWIDHTGDGVDDAVANWSGLGDAAEFNFQWVAPSEDIGPITFWAAGNAINDDFTPAGDIIYLTDATLPAEPPVPTMSEWGMLALMLSLLSAGTILMQRRLRPVPVVARCRG